MTELQPTTDARALTDADVDAVSGGLAGFIAGLAIGLFVAAGVKGGGDFTSAIKLPF